MPSSDDRGELVVAEARSYLGVPWRHQGRARTGIDCVGLVIAVGGTLGVLTYDFTNYQRRTVGVQFLSHFRACLDEVGVPNMRPGDVLVLRDGVYPCHSAILAYKDGRSTIVHAHALRRRVVEENLDEDGWRGKLSAAFRYKWAEARG